METLDNVLAKRNSFDILLDNVLKPIDPKYADSIGNARVYWNGLSLARQRQIYFTLLDMKKKGQYIKENPRFAIEDCTPVPENWNGREGVNMMMKTHFMVRAKYSQTYGVYRAFEAFLFQMTNIKPLNFRIEQLPRKEKELIEYIKNNLISD